MEDNMKKVLLYWLEGEISNLIQVWLCVFISLCYCYAASKFVPKGISRFLLFLPIVFLFFILPLHLHSVHLGITSAFFIAWLANFKLLMFASDKGPLSDPSVSSHLPRFLAVACLPIKIQKINKSPNSKREGDHVHDHGSSSILKYAIKGVVLGSIIKVYDYNDYIHPHFILIMYCFHIYLGLEIILAAAAFVAATILGAELEPTFDEPFLSTSLQDFWGRRWNIMVNRILRPSVYDPVLNLSAKFLVPRKWAPLPAVFSTFIVSGLMHELIFYYMGRVMPTWKTMWFFLIHGTSLIVEIAAKKALKGRWHLPEFVGRILVIGFVMGTGLWLFLPDMLRLDADVRALNEYAAIGAFVKDVANALTVMPSSPSSAANTARM